MHHINKVIRVAGMKRNGNHGIVNWILAQHTGNATFCNALHGSESLSNLRSDPIEAFAHNPNLHKVDLTSPCDKELLLLTYEDHRVGSVIEPKSPEHYRQWIGHSVTRSIEAAKDEELVELARAIFGDVMDIDTIIGLLRAAHCEPLRSPR